MNNIHYKKATIEDLKAVQTIGYITFENAFASQNTEENMATYLDASFSTEKVKMELSNPNSHFYLVKLDDKAIGYFKLNVEDAQSESIENGLEVERIYLLSEYQGLGIGQWMMDTIFDIARSFQKQKLWLGVWQENKGAIRFYERNGFQKFSEHAFFLGTDEQFDDMMEINL